MTEVIDFFFSIQSQLWSLIVSNWILAISVLILILNWVISLVNGSSQDK